MSFSDSLLYCLVLHRAKAGQGCASHLDRVPTGHLGTRTRATPFQATCVHLRECRGRAESLSLARILGAFEMSNIQRRRVTCYTDEIQPLRSFGEGQLGSLQPSRLPLPRHELWSMVGVESVNAGNQNDRSSLVCRKPFADPLKMEPQ
jgi:hypothetical protein